jgi:hypothetical protein
MESYVYGHAVSDTAGRWVFDVTSLKLI